jgi:hypothetical protein
MSQTATIDVEALVRTLINTNLVGAVKEKTVTNKAFSGTSNFQFGHGVGGTFSPPGLSQPVFSAMALPYLGLWGALSKKVSRETNPLYGIFTGVTATSGSEPSDLCANAPIAGLSKLCTHSFQFGRRARRTPNIPLSKVGQMFNQADMMNLEMRGTPHRGSNFKPSFAGNSNNPLRNEIDKALFELGVAMTRDFAREVYTGTPSSNLGEGTQYYYGLDSLINTGYRDAITGTACPASDSLIVTASNQIVNDNGANYQSLISAVYENLRYRAQQFGLTPAKWALVMSYGLFYQLTEFWACNYLSYRCSNTNNSGNPVVTNSDDVLQMQLGMRGNMDEFDGQYLLINGEKVQVIIDDAITETVSGGVWSTQLYFVPLTVLGGGEVTYFEYFDMSMGAAGATYLAPSAAIQAVDGGMFMLSRDYSNSCVALQAEIKPRLLLLTPQIAGRIHSIRYRQSFAARSWETSNTYFYNGGATTYAGIPGFGTGFYSPTN